MTRDEAIARAQLKAAQAQLHAVLLAQPDNVRGCSDPHCPGPGASSGGCPMGYAGSCRRTRSGYR
jgi:hypothetical protein